MFHNINFEPVNQPGKYDPFFILNQDTSVNYDNIDYVKMNGHYATMDPRTFDSPRAERLYFDTPPRVSSNTLPQGDIYNMKTNHIGFYKDYESIRGGDIVYYNDLDNDEPNGGPQFFIPAYTIPTMLVDPMGAHKPYYLRVPIFDKNNSMYEYSFDQDQCEWREDLIALQSQKSNTSSFGAFQLYNDPERYYPMYKPRANGTFPLYQENSSLFCGKPI
jgi:hypothetical protein